LIIDYGWQFLYVSRRAANPLALDRRVWEAFMSKLFSLAKMVDISHSSRRSLQFWVEAGALRPTAGTDREGRGIHRRFDRSELILACVLGACSQVNLPIGRLIGISRGFRDDLMMKDRAAVHIEAAIIDSAKVFLIVEPGLDLVLLSDPDEGELYECLIRDMIEISARFRTSRTIFYLNPWLKDVPTTPG
jgi:hypothetical protein